MMTFDEFQEFLMNAVDAYNVSGESDFQVSDLRTFSEAGLMSNSRGLVVTMADGSEFQVEILGSY